MDTVDVKVSELIGAALDWAVAKAEGYDVSITILGFRHDFEIRLHCTKSSMVLSYNYNPSVVWSEGGSLIQSRRVAVDFTRPVQDDEPVNWVAQVWQPYGYATGATPLIAACRAIATAHFGDVVSVPAELVTV